MALPESASPGVDPQGFRWFTTVAIVAALVWAGVHLLVGSPWTSIFLLVTTLIFWAAHALHPRIGYRRAQRISLGNAFALILALTVWTGGLGGLTGIWLFLLPVAAALFLGAREAALWSLGLAVAVIAVGVAELLGGAFPNPIRPEHVGTLSLASQATALVALVCLSLIYAYGQELALERLRTSHEDLQGAHRQVQGSEARLRELIRAIERMEEHVVVVVDLKGAITYAGGTEETYGVPGRELVGHPLDVLGEEVRRATLPGITGQTPIAPLTGEGSPRTFEVTSRRPDGSSFPLQVSAAPVLDPEGRVDGVVIIGKDRTAEVEAQERLLQSSKLASVGELVAGVAHELNNPLTVTMNLSSLLEEELDGQPAEDAAAIREQAERASRIVRGLLTFSRRAPAERVRVDVNRLVERVIRERRGALGGRAVEISAELAPDLFPIDADPVQLEQVLTNLIQNSVQSLREEQGAGRVTVRTEQVDDTLKVTVSDNGPGIHPDVLPRIFDPFVTTRPAGEGTGLGLSVSHGIVTGHGGTIEAGSPEDGGAEFIVRLPAAVQHPLELAETLGGTDGEPKAPPRRRRILVVDDEEPIRRALVRFLGRRGHTVEEAESGDQALAKLHGEGYDAVLLDLKMPGMSGQEVFVKLKERSPGTAARVIFATGDVVSTDTSTFLRSSGRPVIEKPYRLADISAAVEAM
jgi:PAS domain S-box-containing protein